MTPMTPRAPASEREAALALLAETDLWFKGGDYTWDDRLRFDAAREAARLALAAHPTPPPPLPPNTRLILVSDSLVYLWATRTERGERISVEWGEPRPEGWYEPVFTVHSDDVLPAATPSPDAGRMTEALAAMAPLFHEYAIDAAEADWPDVHPGVPWDLCPDDLCAKARRLLGKDGDQEMERLAAR